MVDDFKCLPDTARQLHIWTHRCCDSIHKPCEPQVRPNPSLDRGGRNEVPYLAEEKCSWYLLGEGMSFSLRVLLLVGESCPGRRLHIHGYMGTTNQSLCFWMKNKGVA